MAQYRKMPVDAETLRVLKEPFGTLIKEAQINKSALLEFLRHPAKIITVGDASTDRLLSFGIIPDIAVVDNIERRIKRKTDSKIKITIPYAPNELRCSNMAGEISHEALEVLKVALRSLSPVKIVVSGEEDLLALPVFVMAPLHSTVFYGQPLEGIVAVQITRQSQKKAKDLMDRITIS